MNHDPALICNDNSAYWHFNIFDQLKLIVKDCQITLSEAVARLSGLIAKCHTNATSLTIANL